MRIISKFHDYYDTAMAYGHDESTVYVRNFEIITDKHKADSYTPLFGISPGRGEKRNTKFSVMIRPFVVAFCGLTYKGVWVRTSRLFPSLDEIGPPADECFYNYEAFATHLKKFGFDLLAAVDRNRWSHQHSLARSETLRWQTFLSAQGSTEFEQMLIENRVVSLLYASNTFDELLQGKWRLIQGNDPYVVLNPSLRAIDFYKVFDAFSTFQELEMYLGGVLPKPGAMMVNIEDKYRIPQHGFDKWSFRKQGEPK
jgi:hypothetical protein